jgi:MYXO-CTERM domain-containing protein
MSKQMIVVGSVLLALAGPSAALGAGPAPQDLRSPDARDAAVHPQPVGGIDLRSPDAQDSSHAATVGQSAPSVTSSDDGGSGVPVAFGVIAALGLASGLTLVATRRRHQGEARPAVKA